MSKPAEDHYLHGFLPRERGQTPGLGADEGAGFVRSER